jgi:aminotransferase EvaB
MNYSNENINVWSYLEEYKEYDSELFEIISEVFNSGRLILGKNLEQFENNFSKWVGVNYGTGVGNGTDAIKLALLSLGIGKGDEVITVSNTAVPTVSAIIETGAEPVFCDVNFDDFNISVDLIEDLITNKTKALVCVHLYGHPADVFKIKQICTKYKIALVEDCAQSHGSMYKEKLTGSFGKVSAFSFYPTKTLGGFGDGGMCLTNNKSIDTKLKMLRFYGMKDQYFAVIERGVNSRLDEVHAAILNFKLKRLDDDIKKRRKIAKIYNQELSNTDLILPIEKTNYFHSYYVYVVRHPNRNKIMKQLKDNGINVNISYPFPIHTMPPFKKYKTSTLRNTTKLAKEIFSLPMYPGLSEQKLTKTINVLKDII